MEPTILAKAKDKSLIKKCRAVMKHIRSATFLLKNVSKGMKNRLMELEQLLGRVSYYRQTLRVTEDSPKAEATAPPTESTVSANGSQSERG